MEMTVYKHIDETIYTEVMENGLKVALLPRPDSTKSYAYFTAKYGSNDITFIPIGETEKAAVPLGVAHFLEHKMFDKDDYDVAADFAKLSGSPNALTSSTQTSYLFSATDNIEQNVELLLTFVQDPYFTDQKVEKEKGIITQEAKMYLDNPDYRMYMETLDAMFQNHPIKYPVIGTLESINNTTKEDLYMSYQTFYHPSNMTLTIAGNFNVQKMIRLIRKNQAEKQFAVPQPIQRFYPYEPKAVAEAERNITMPVSSARCMVGIKEYSKQIDRKEYSDRLLLTSMVLDYLFGRSGPFYKQLYDQGLIDQTFNYFSVCEPDFGYSLIRGNTDNPAAFSELVKELLSSTNELKLSEQTIERMKKRMIGVFLRGMNAVDGIAQQYTWYENRELDYFEMIPTIQAFTLEEVNRFLSNWIEGDRLTVCTVSSESF